MCGSKYCPPVSSILERWRQPARGVREGRRASLKGRQAASTLAGEGADDPEREWGERRLASLGGRARRRRER